MTLAELRISSDAGIVIAQAGGEIDMSNAGSVREATWRAMPIDALGLILDLTDTEYLDSAGIHLIFGLRESLRDRGQSLWLVIPADSMIHDAMRLAGVGEHLTVYATLIEAQEAATV